MQAEFVVNFKKPAVKVPLVIQGVLRRAIQTHKTCTLYFQVGYLFKQENQTNVVCFCIGKGNQSRFPSEIPRIFKVSTVLDANINFGGKCRFLLLGNYRW
jgi:hypothetical protein